MAATNPIRVFVVEDSPRLLRSQLKLLQGVDALQVVGTAVSGEAALEEIPRANPDVVLLDLGLPGLGGIEVTRRLKAAHPAIELLIFTVFDEEEKVLEAVRAGASGYLLKGASLEKLVEAIREVKAGGSVIQPSLARRLLRHFRPAGDGTADAAPAPARVEVPPRALSPREAEILQLIAKGVSNAEAAQVLDLSRATIRTHLEHIYRKLEVTNRVEAVTEGIRQGLIEV